MDTEATDQQQEPLNPLTVRDSAVNQNLTEDETPLNEEEVSSIIVTELPCAG